MVQDRRSKYNSLRTLVIEMRDDLLDFRERFDCYLCSVLQFMPESFSDQLRYATDITTLQLCYESPFILLQIWLYPQKRMEATLSDDIQSKGLVNMDTKDIAWTRTHLFDENGRTGS